jgi:hypothetical protein
VPKTGQRLGILEKKWGTKRNPRIGRRGSRQLRAVHAFPRLSDLGHQLKSAGRRGDYLHLTVTWVGFLSQEQHPY